MCPRSHLPPQRSGQRGGHAPARGRPPSLPWPGLSLLTAQVLCSSRVPSRGAVWSRGRATEPAAATATPSVTARLGSAAANARSPSLHLRLARAKQDLPTHFTDEDQGSQHRNRCCSTAGTSRAPGGSKGASRDPASHPGTHAVLLPPPSPTHSHPALPPRPLPSHAALPPLGAPPTPRDLTCHLQTRCYPQAQIPPPPSWPPR